MDVLLDPGGSLLAPQQKSGEIPLIVFDAGSQNSPF
jgi:hypothetical protein